MSVNILYSVTNNKMTLQIGMFLMISAMIRVTTSEPKLLYGCPNNRCCPNICIPSRIHALNFFESDTFCIDKRLKVPDLFYSNHVLNGLSLPGF